MQIARQEDWTAVEIVAAALQYLRDEHSGLVLWLLRALAACELLQRREVYERFLPGLEGLRRLPEGAEGMEAVVSGLVLQDGVDAEHPMIQALSTLLRVPLAVVYASGDAPVRVRSSLYVACLPWTCSWRQCLASRRGPHGDIVHRELTQKGWSAGAADRADARRACGLAIERSAAARAVHVHALPPGPLRPALPRGRPMAQPAAAVLSALRGAQLVRSEVCGDLPGSR